MIGRVGLLACLVAAPALAQAPFDSASRWVDSLLAPYASARMPGCVVGVTRDGKLVLDRSAGMADLARGVPLSDETRFYVASLSKQFTAMSIVLLAQDGRLSLDDSVRRWIPELPAVTAPITLRQLLHHTSGLRDYVTLLAVSGWPVDGELTERQFIDMMRRQKTLNFTPGDEFLYSNTGYALLAIVVKRASGESLRDFAQRRIFGPLGMTSTEFRDDHRETIPNRAIGYESTEHGVVQTNPQSDVVGDAGVYTTLRDLAKWDANFASPVVGGAAAIAQMTAPGRLNNGQSIPYGLALTVGELRGMKTIAHSGAYGGYRSELLRFPDVNVGVLTLCNSSAVSPSLAEQVGTLVLGVRPAAPPSTTGMFGSESGPYASGTFTAPTDSAATARRRNDQLARIAGTYYSDELDLTVSLLARDGALFLKRPNSVDMRFGSFTNDLFTSSDRMLLRVVRDDAGAVTGFTLTISRVRDLEFERREPEHAP